MSFSVLQILRALNSTRDQSIKTTRVLIPASKETKKPKIKHYCQDQTLFTAVRIFFLALGVGSNQKKNKVLNRNHFVLLKKC